MKQNIINKIIVLIYAISLFLFFTKNCSAFYEIINLNIKIENYIKKINPNLKEKQYKKIAKTIIKQSLYYEIPWNIVLAIMEIESNFNPLAIGAAGEIGLMQIFTRMCFDIKANEKRLFEIRYNIAFGLCILHDKLRIAKNDIVKAIKFYNGSGPKAKEYVLKVFDTLEKINKEFY